jgi:hypothetical protein
MVVLPSVRVHFERDSTRIPDRGDYGVDHFGVAVRSQAWVRPDCPAGSLRRGPTRATYISAARTHKAAARRLGVPYGTYRRHLTLARERLVEQLLRQLH